MKKRLFMIAMAAIKTVYDCHGGYNDAFLGMSELCC